MTQKYLKELVSYEPVTGVMKWKKVSPRNRKNKVGDVVGSIEKCGYVRVFIEGKYYKVHRLAWLYVHGYMPKTIDHINHDKADNVLSNLREVTVKDNNRNKKSKKTFGIFKRELKYYPYTIKYGARITVDNKHIYLGLHDTEAEAIKARKEAEVKYGFHANHGS